jgi:uncharacterized caspase-like protein
MLRLALTIAVAWLCLFGAAADAQDYGRRLAVVIGNSDYQSAPKLKNAVGDADLIAGKFEDAGFEVTRVLNGGLDQMVAAIDKVANEAHAKDHVVFYYSGHGFQLDGTNYLVPIDAVLTSEDLIHSRTVQLNTAIGKLQASGAQVMAFIDACRDNPLPPSTRGDRSVNGLAKLGTGLADNLFVAYAAGPGQVSYDGTGDHSPFALAVADNLLQPDRGLDTMVRYIRNEVKESTQDKQVVWSESSLTDEFYFIGGQKVLLDIGTPVQVADVNPATVPVFDSDALVSRPSSSSEPPPSPSSSAEPAQTTRAAGEVEPSSEPSFEEVPASAFVDESSSSSEFLVANLPSSSSVEPVDITDLTLQLQIQLTRLGCYSGDLDRKWGSGSKKAVQAFADAAGIMVAVLEPSPDLLQKLRTYQGRVCPLQCAVTEVERNGQCVTKTCPQGQKLSTKGACYTPQAATPKPPKTTPPANQGGGGKTCFTFNGETFCE